MGIFSRGTGEIGGRRVVSFSGVITTDLIEMIKLTGEERLLTHEDKASVILRIRSSESQAQEKLSNKPMFWIVLFCCVLVIFYSVSLSKEHDTVSNVISVLEMIALGIGFAVFAGKRNEKRKIENAEKLEALERDEFEAYELAVVEKFSGESSDDRTAFEDKYDYYIQCYGFCIAVNKIQYMLTGDRVGVVLLRCPSGTYLEFA